MKKISILLGLLVAALVLGQCPPASAETGTAYFARGGVPPRIDLVRMSADNGQDRIRVVLRVRDLRRSGTFVVGYDDPRDRFHFSIVLEMREAGPHADYLWSHPGSDEEYAWDCADSTLKWQAARNRVVFDVAQSCFPVRVPRRWRLRAGAWDWFGDDARSDYPERELTLARG